MGAGMKAYTAFAQVYDIFMDNVPYDEWTEYLTVLLEEYGIKEGLVLELGCGTGNVTRRLASKGYDMIGIDNSEEMLEIARDIEFENFNDYDTEMMDEEILDNDTCDYDEETRDFLDKNDSISKDENEYLKNNSILYLQQDMRSFELYGTVAAVVSICDSMNYIISEQDLLKVFQLVNNYLDAGGIFIFDMNTEYKYKNLLANNTIAENREDCSFIWENYYDSDKMLNEYEVTMFIKTDQINHNLHSEAKSEDLLFERYQETHYQKAYSINTIMKLLEEAGMEFVTVYDAITHNPPTETSERIYFIAKEKYQNNKKYITKQLN
jgi:SAM-dependent methyltransferase